MPPPAPTHAGAAMMDSLPDQFHALVIGASGSIGAAFVDLLRAAPRCAVGHRPCTASRRRPSISATRTALPPPRAASPRPALPPDRQRRRHPAHRRIHARKAPGRPQRSADAGDFPGEHFRPRAGLRHFAPLLERERAMLAVLSAKVGSIGDNRLGGWYSYRGSKAALNMLVKTAAIEVARTSPTGCWSRCIRARSIRALSQPFQGRDHRPSGAGRRRRHAGRARCADAGRQRFVPVV